MIAFITEALEIVRNAKAAAARFGSWRHALKAAGINTRGISDHHFIHSIYFRDTNGYVIELTAKVPGHESDSDPAKNGARAQLDDRGAGA